MTDSIDELLQYLGHLNTGTIQWELKKYQAIREWAMAKIGIDYRVGDRVVIAESIPTGNGWAAYEEALTIDTTGVVEEIDFSPHHGSWYALVVLDYAWQVSPPGDSPESRAQFRQEREGNWTVPEPPDPIPAVPIWGEDYRGLCANPDCAICGRPGRPCGEWMGMAGASWCPRCGWALRYHPKEIPND
jgi:hypothetical protein